MIIWYIVTLKTSLHDQCVKKALQTLFKQMREKHMDIKKRQEKEHTKQTNRVRKCVNYKQLYNLFVDRY